MGELKGELLDAQEASERRRCRHDLGRDRGDLAQRAHDRIAELERERDELREYKAECLRNCLGARDGESRTWVAEERLRAVECERDEAVARAEEAETRELQTLRRSYNDGFSDATLIYATELPSPDDLDDELEESFLSRRGIWESESATRPDPERSDAGEEDHDR